MVVFSDLLPGEYSAVGAQQQMGSSSLPTTPRKTRERPRIFFCEDCGKGFTSGYKLRRHSVTHTGEKPHKCKICGRGYTQSNDLRYHEKRAHPELLATSENTQFRVGYPLIAVKPVNILLPEIGSQISQQSEVGQYSDVIEVDKPSEAAETKTDAVKTDSPNVQPKTEKDNGHS